MRDGRSVGIALSGAPCIATLPTVLLRGDFAAGCSRFDSLRQAIAQQATEGPSLPVFIASASELEDVPRAVADLLAPELVDRSLVVSSPATPAQWMAIALASRVRPLDVLGAEPSPADWRAVLAAGRQRYSTLASEGARMLTQTVAVDDVPQAVALLMCWWGGNPRRERRVVFSHDWLRRPTRLQVIGRIARTLDAFSAGVPRTDDTAEQIGWRSLRQSNEWLRRTLGTSDIRAFGGRTECLRAIRRLLLTCGGGLECVSAGEFFPSDTDLVCPAAPPASSRRVCALCRADTAVVPPVVHGPS